MQPRYIVEITIHPFVYKAIDPVALQLHPVYEDEEGRCYFRRTASTAAVSMSVEPNPVYLHAAWCCLLMSMHASTS
jgi:hypothetical protein